MLPSIEINERICNAHYQLKGLNKEVEENQQNYNQIIHDTFQINNDNIKKLQNLECSIEGYKNKIVYSLDNILHKIVDQIKIIQLFNQKILTFTSSHINNQSSIEEIKSECYNQQKKIEVIKNEIQDQLENFKKQYFVINFQESFNNEVVSYDLTHQVDEFKLENQVKQMNNKFQYELVCQKKFEYCYAFAFNKENNILFIACDRYIRVYQFINGQIIKELQKLFHHTQDVISLYFMRKSNQLASGSADTQIVIWQLDQDKQWIVNSVLDEFQAYILCIVMNEDENLLISGSPNETIKFWKKNEFGWSCQQTLDTNVSVTNISLNEQENKLILFGFSDFIQVLEIQNDLKWAIVQTIKVNQRGYRGLFTIGDQFVYQPETLDNLEIYDFDISKKQFEKISEIKIQSCKQCFICFPCQFIKQQNILTVKHGQYLNIFKIFDDGNYQLIQQIEFKDYKVFGRLTDDGQYLITYNFELDIQLEIRKLQLIQ